MKLPKIRIFKESVNRSTAGNVAIFIILLLFAAFFLLPVIYVVMSAFKPLDEILIFPPRFFVRHPTTTNFTSLGVYVNDFWVPLSRYIFNSVFMTVLGVGGGLVLGSMAAYPLAKHKFPGKACLLYTSRSMTAGRGSFTLKFERYEEVPANIAQKVISESNADENEAK